MALSSWIARLQNTADRRAGVHFVPPARRWRIETLVQLVLLADLLKSSATHLQEAVERAVQIALPRA
eukprot:5445010-Alexandrium_andersonii.AAC.1